MPGKVLIDLERPRTLYANVDLDIYSRVPLDAFVEAMGKKVDVLYVGGATRKYEAHLELSALTRSADDTIEGLARVVRGLPRAQRRTWNSAQRREFNVGIDAGLEPHSFELRLRPRTLKAIAELKGVLVVTVYAPDLEASRRPAAGRRTKISARSRSVKRRVE